MSISVACRANAQVGSAGCGAEAITKGSRLERSLEVGGVTRSFILDVPDSIQPRKPVALILDFHGFGHSAEGVWRVSGFRELGVRERFITAYPQGHDVRLLERQGVGWDMFALDGNRDIAFTRALLDRIESEYCIDRQRIFVTGFSNGAFLTHLLGCALADRIAAIAPVSGGAVNVPCEPARPIPVMIHHGSKDAIVNVDRARDLFQQWKKLDGCQGERKDAAGSCTRAVDCRNGTSVVYCEGDGEHRWPVEATAEIWQFFKTHPMQMK